MADFLDIIDYDPGDKILACLRQSLENINHMAAFGITINVADAYRKYRAALPWWRRWFWPRLSRLEKQRAILNAVLARHDG